ncbi:MAG TPA: hypothetical protein VH684_13665 [Xanthobacteraceae bacterium]
MSTLAHRLTAMAAVTHKPRRVSLMALAAIAVAVALATGFAYSQLPQFGKGLMARVNSDLAYLDQRWRAAREATRNRYRTSGRVECLGNYDPYWETQEIANRVHAGERIFVGCLTARIAYD